VLRRVAERLRAFELRDGSVRTLRQCGLLGVALSRLVSEVRIPSRGATGFEGGDRVESLLRRGRNSHPSSGVGNNLKRHVTLHTNVRKFSSTCLGSLCPLVLVGRHESSGVGLSLGSRWAMNGLPP
jgi:hypothetical protein